MRRRWVLVGVTSLTGCSLLPQTPYLQRRDWPLDVHRPSVEPRNQHGRVLLLRSVRSGPGLEARGMQWLQRDGSLHVDFYEQWAVPPAQAVENDLRQWLADSGRFSAVVAPGSRLNAGFVLEGELDAFVADLKTGMARVALALVLIDQRQGATTVLLQRTVTAEVRLAGDEPPAIADAMKAAIVDVLRQTETDIAAAVH
ncbi:MAG: ABC-type transport auxiliary lipoprotein family protein [Acetobacteraceae bacterium]|jgi:cholesterol transport system auxiliary component